MGELDEWKFCPRCGGPIELEDGGSKASCARCGFRDYASSKVTACAVVVDDLGRVLVARRKAEPFEGHWDLPGGFVQEGEHPEEALRRELREETSLEIEPEELLGIWTDTYSEDGSGAATMNLYWTARVRSGEADASDDVAELRWFAPDELPPPDEFAFHVGEVISAFRARHEHA